MSRLSSAQISEENNSNDPSSISSLQLSHRALSNISCLTDFKNLEKLDLTFNTLSTVEALKSCVNLKWLSIAQNKLQSLKGIEGLSKLTVLNAGRNKLTSMDEVGSLINLRALILNDNNISTICGLDHLQWLNTLVLSRNPIGDIGVSLSKAKSIAKLSLSHCQVQTIGSSLGHCLDLKEVRLNNNEIMMLPAELAQNVKIRNLDLGNNLISKCSDLKVLSSLNSLKNLNLQGNPIAEQAKLPKKIYKLVPNLKIFNAKPTGKDHTKMKRNFSGQSEDASNVDVIPDLAIRTKVKGKKLGPSLDSGVIQPHKGGARPIAFSGLDDGKKVKQKKQSLEGDKPETIGCSSIPLDLEDVKKVERKSKSIEVSKPEGTEDRKKVNRKRKSENVVQNPPSGLDDSETPFAEIIFSSNIRDTMGVSNRERNAETSHDVKSLTGMVSVCSRKKKKPKMGSPMGHAALTALMPPPEIGMGGPSTWDD